MQIRQAPPLSVPESAIHPLGSGCARGVLGLALASAVGFAQIPQPGQRGQGEPDRPVVAAPADDIQVAIQKGAYPFNRKSPDFSVMDPRLAKAKLIGVGQQTHGTREIFETQCSLMRYAIEKHGVRSVYFESGPSGLSLINDSLRAGAVGPIDMTGIVESFQVRAVADFFTWVRDWNTKHPADQVEILGVDLQNTSFAGFEKDILAAVPKAERPTILATLKRIESVHPNATRKRDEFYRGLDLDVHVEAKVDVIRLMRRFERELAISHKPETEKAFLATRSLWGGLEIVGLKVRTPQIGKERKLPCLTDVTDWLAFRERFVAEQVMTHMRFHPERKGMWFAHSAHLVKMSPDGWPLMGGWISAALDEGYCNITVTTGGGSVWTVPPEKAGLVEAQNYATLNQISKPVPFTAPKTTLESRMFSHANGADLLVDVSKGGQGFMRQIGTLYIGNIIGASDPIDAPSDPGRSSDFIIFLGRTTATEPLVFDKK